MRDPGRVGCRSIVAVEEAAGSLPGVRASGRLVVGDEGSVRAPERNRVTRPSALRSPQPRCCREEERGQEGGHDGPPPPAAEGEAFVRSVGKEEVGGGGHDVMLAAQAWTEAVRAADG